MTKSGFCACAITFQPQSNAMYVYINKPLNGSLSLRRTLTFYLSSARERRFLSPSISARKLTQFREQNVTREQRVERACRNQYNEYHDCNTRGVSREVYRCAYDWECVELNLHTPTPDWRGAYYAIEWTLWCKLSLSDAASLGEWLPTETWRRKRHFPPITVLVPLTTRKKYYS